MYHLFIIANLTRAPPFWTGLSFFQAFNFCVCSSLEMLSGSDSNILFTEPEVYFYSGFGAFYSINTDCGACLRAQIIASVNCAAS